MRMLACHLCLAHCIPTDTSGRGYTEGFVVGKGYILGPLDQRSSYSAVSKLFHQGCREVIGEHILSSVARIDFDINIESKHRR